MTDITVTAAQIAPVVPEKAQIKSYLAAAAITKGQALYLNTTGKVDLADSDAGGTAQFRGVSLTSAGTGQAVDVLENGEVYGFGVSTLDADAMIYLSGTAGNLNDTTGTVPTVCGRVSALADASVTKVLRVFSRPSADWS